MVSIFRKLAPLYLILAAIPICHGQILGLSRAAEPVRFWITQAGQPWAYVTQHFLFLREDSGYTLTRGIPGVRQVFTSPNGKLALLEQHEPSHTRANQSMHTNFLVVSQTGEIKLDWEEDNAADETRWHAAISNEGFLALIDPGYARFKLISPTGKVISEKKLIKNEQLAENTTVFNLERKGRIGWIDDHLFILLEKRAFRAEPEANVELFAFNSQGNLVWQNHLALTQIQGALFDQAGIFVAGYDWTDTSEGRSFRHQLIQFDPEKSFIERQWQIPAKSLTISMDGNWLGVLGDTETAFRIDLKSGRSDQYSYKSESELINDLAISNSGEVLGLIVSRANYNPLEIFNNNQVKLVRLISGELLDVKTSGVYQNQLHLENDGEKFFLGDNKYWREVGE